MPRCAEPERELRDLGDEFLLELEAKVAGGEPLSLPTPDDRWHGALALWARALAEAAQAGVDIDQLPGTSPRPSRISAEVAEAPDDRVVVEEAASEVCWAAGRVEDFRALRSLRC